MENEFYVLIGKLLKQKQDLTFELKKTQEEVAELQKSINEIYGI